MNNRRNKMMPLKIKPFFKTDYIKVDKLNQLQYNNLAIEHNIYRKEGAVYEFI